MCIYKKRTPSRIYRNVYEKHYGPIPKDEYGRSYEIHHIDGDHSNNEPLNLRAVTIQEHYDIHYSQGDWGACQSIAVRMKKDAEEISILASQAQKKKVSDNTHNFLGGDIQRRTHQRMKDSGTHFSQRESFKEQISVISTKLMKDGVLHKLNYEDLMKSGRHPSQIKKTCDHCDKTCSINMFARFHGDKCKLKPPF